VNSAACHPDQDGTTHKLAIYKGQEFFVFLYQKDETPGFVFTQ